MFQSLRHSQLALRIGLAAVFFWFGLDKFIQPQYWISMWLPLSVQQAVIFVHASPSDFIFLIGIFEILVAVSLLTGFFMRWFAIAATLFLVAVIGFHGFNEVLVHDIALIGGLIALVLWPQRTYV